MPGPDNWTYLVPLWLRPIASFTACVFIFYGFVRPMWPLCSTIETCRSWKVHTVRSSPPERFLVALLDSLSPLFSVFHSQTPTLSFLPETRPEFSSAIHNSKTDKNSLFTVPYQSITMSAFVCVKVSVFWGIGDSLQMCVSVPKWGAVWWMCVCVCVCVCVGGCQPWLC